MLSLKNLCLLAIIMSVCTVQLATAICASDYDLCFSNSQCCSGYCLNIMCRRLPRGCKDEGRQCKQQSECSCGACIKASPSDVYGTCTARGR